MTTSSGMGGAAGAADAAGAAPGHAPGAHVSHLGHHYGSLEQQSDAGKLGMWLFLVTEILLFGGLFCAYAVYRAQHPEIFVYAHRFLDKTLGGINTVVLICSSLTMAWAVRAAQLGNRRQLSVLLAATFLCACGFLGIKAVEYEHKWKHGLLWGKRYQPVEHVGQDAHSDSGHAQDVGIGSHADVGPAASAEHAGAATSDSARSTLPETASGPGGMATAAPEADTPHGTAQVPRNVHLFFGIYFVMTGLHGLHVIAGMVVLAWLFVRTARGEFGDGYFAAVDLGGLYWHLVDLVWIFLFPLLYLVH